MEAQTVNELLKLLRHRDQQARDATKIIYDAFFEKSWRGWVLRRLFPHMTSEVLRPLSIALPFPKDLDWSPISDESAPSLENGVAEYDDDDQTNPVIDLTRKAPARRRKNG